MSTTDTPQTPTPDAAETHAAAPSPEGSGTGTPPAAPSSGAGENAAPSTEASNGHASAQGGEHAEGRSSEGEHAAAESPEGEGHAEEGDEGEGDAPANGAAEGAGAGGPGHGERKRRRRRRKKKGGAQVGAEGAAAEGAEGAAGEGAAAAGEGAAGEGAAGEGEGTEGASAEGGPAAKTEGRPKRKEKEKRQGPPRERPPVNGGDIVFGKIVEIADDAIFVDIPGKAHAIFDRRELLLPEEEEVAPGSPVGPPGRHGREPAEGEAAHAQEAAHEGAVAEASTGASVAEASTGASVAEASTGASVAEASPAAASIAEAPAAASDAGAVDATPGETEGEIARDAVEAAHEAHPDPDAPSAAHAAPPAAFPEDSQASEGHATDAAAEPAPELAREPKVPRVILEVGADFIAVVHNDGARGGLVVLTHHPRRAERAKPILEAAFNEKTLVEGLVTGIIKGGVEVDVDGVRAFAPGSHVELRLGADLSHLVGRRLPFLVTQYAKRGRDVVLSRRSMLEDEAKKARTEALAKLKVGDELDGIVRSVVPFGAFVDVGGIEGLVPLKEMSHNRSDGPSDVFKAGEPTRVKVVMIDDKGKVWLSRRATIPDPWQQVAKKYSTGTRHTGKIVRLKDFGAFVELEPGVDGLIHTQDLSVKRIEDPSEVVKVGDTLEVVVSHVDGSNHKIALHPAPQGDAAGEAPQRVVPHKPVKAKIANIESGGLVVRIMGVTGRNARGYVTAAATGTPRGTELRKAFSVNQEIEAKVIEIDPRRGEVKLSIKALSEDQERNAYQQYRQQLKAEARFTFGDLLAKKGTPSR